MIKIFLAIGLQILSFLAIAQINIVPMPAEVVMGAGTLVLKKQVGFIFNDELKNGDGGIALFQQYLQKKYGFKKFEKGDTHTYGLATEIFIETNNSDTTNAYELEITTKYIKITGKANAIFYAFETIKQLITKNKNGQIKLPVLKIKDQPRFAYRGMHLDVGRHFFSVDKIKKYIDYLATYKFNTFHWHLTEDQGWRIEIKQYPNLTKVGAYRDRTLLGRYGSNVYDNKKYGGFYTQAQIKEVVAYATQRYITVIPEIEMPGHSTAALASYPYLGCTKGPYKVMDTWGVLVDVYCAGNDSTFTFLQNVLDEVLPLFPSKYIHIGGDECPKKRWQKCQACQKRIADNHLKDEHALQSYFIQRIEKYVNSKGKSIIGWDEILEGGLAPNATVMSWRGENGGIEAATQNHQVIMTPSSHCYLDHSQTKNEDSITIGNYLPLEKVYSYEPVPAVLTATQAKFILGAQGNVWTEYMNNSTKLEYMIFPRMIALSEVLWSPKEKRNWPDFERRLPIIFERLDEQKINYSKAYYDIKATVLPTHNNDGVVYQVQAKNANSFVHILPIGRPYGMYDSVFVYDKNGRGNNKYTAVKRNIDTSKKIIQLELKYSNGDSFPGNEFLLNAESLQKNTYAQLSKLEQAFFINKATGKKIMLNITPNKSYPGDGAFTLVNGIQNTKGLARSTEMLGFLGKEVQAVVDLGNPTIIKMVQLHHFEKRSSWIYPPQQSGVSVLISTDGINYIAPEMLIAAEPNTNSMFTTYNFAPTHVQFVKIIAKPFGIIPQGMPGEGTAAWLFLHEIVVF